jgi:4-hydroxyphenylpyruvate dioxygenase-like putative hemolysin
VAELDLVANETIIGSTQHLEVKHMADLFENPAGLDGFEFIEFSAP